MTARTWTLILLAAAAAVAVYHANTECVMPERATIANTVEIGDKCK